MDAGDDRDDPPVRYESQQDTAQGGAAPHPRVVQFRRESNPRFSKSFDIRRGSRSVDLVKGQDELSPLIAPRRSEDAGALPFLSSIVSPDEEEDQWDEGRSQQTKSSWYLIWLTMAIGGLQIAWSVELSNGSPYLLGLGISKSFLALVWIAGPLSGTLVQPYVGIKSDRCRSRWGKRKPFMVGGAIATIVSLMCLAWTKEIVGGFLHLFGVSREARGVYITAIVFAVAFIYILDFSINVIQAGVRAFIVDNAPTHQQEDANAWASRISGVGNILGYLSGYVDLPRIMPFFGDTQFKVLCVIACLALAITLSISCFAIRERDPRLEGEPAFQKGGLVAFFVELFRSIRRLPPQISKVCQVQFFAWIGWFPFLFYITTYIGEIYVEPIFEANPNMTSAEIDRTWVHATRTGTFALLVFAITTFASSVFLPMIIAPTFRAPQPPLKTPMTPTTPGLPATPGSASTPGYFTYHPASSHPSLSPKKYSLYRRIISRLPSTHIHALTLRRAWLISHLLFALATWLTFFVHTVTGATILVGFIGIPWALTNWAPFALIAAEISKRDAIRRGQLRAPSTREGELLVDGADPGEGADQAGVVLGIHNVAIAAPQVIATLVSSAIFRVLQKPRGSVGDDSVAWVLRFGGLAALVAAYLTMRVGEESEERK
ncbi:hypothetical protein LTR66_000039 [Elasticomyces elasticus]|nr:hypothetical protein LTR50_007262 [Elasticomyces elasticus]KAK5001262.1 hypothetical protein LTR66_000039 [Elasticomyces elasticus]